MTETIVIAVIELRVGLAGLQIDPHATKCAARNTQRGQTSSSSRLALRVSMIPRDGVEVMSAQTSSTGPVTAVDVRNAKFQLIRRGGYDPAQVDPFLEVIAQTIDGGPQADPRITSDYIHGVRFTTVRRGGYLPAQVDAFLDRVIDTFDQGIHQGAAGVAPQYAPQPALPAPIDEAPPAAQAVPPIQTGFVEAAPPAPVAAMPPPPVVTAPPASPMTPTAPHAPAALSAAQPGSPEADFDMLRSLHTSGVLSDKEFAVLGARVKRRIDAQQANATV
jgi:DivIVA domain-containing protein